jgi:hypothetical protein
MSSKLGHCSRVLESLGLDPLPSPRRLAIIAERERACGVSFPAAIREWFAVDGVGDAFRDNTNHDELIDNNVVGELDKLNALGDPDQVAEGYLLVAVENQGVVAWFARLDGSDDPPIVQADPDELYDDDGELVDLAEVEWTPCTDTFTEFIEEMLLG